MAGFGSKLLGFLGFSDEGENVKVDERKIVSKIALDGLVEEDDLIGNNIDWRRERLMLGFGQYLTQEELDAERDRLKNYKF